LVNYVLFTAGELRLFSSDMEKQSLRRCLGPAGSVLLVSGLMIGTGVFKKIAPMAGAGITGPYILLAWTVAGGITLLGAFSYAGLSQVTTETGGVYEYLRLAFGEFIAFVYGWAVFTIIGSGSIAALAFICSQSANSLLLLPGSPGFFGDLAHRFSDSGVKLFAVLLILALTWINVRGVRKGSNFNNLFTCIKILGILVLILAGLWFAGRHPLSSPDAAPEHLTGLALFSAFFGSMLSALYAYEGWVNITFIAGEVRKPERNLPLAIIGGVGLVMLLYVLLNYSFLTVIPLSKMAVMKDNMITGIEFARTIFASRGAVLMALFIMVSGLGSLNACIMVFARVYFRMAQQGVFFPRVASVHPRFKTPHVSLYLSAAWCSVLVFSGSFEVLSNMLTLSGFIFFGLGSMALIRLKTRKVIGYKVIGYPVGPVLIIAFCLALLIISLKREPLTSLTSLALIGSGMPFYFYFKSLTKNEGLP
jgi:basic amino acid/polyamine antiporter, APA family